MDHLSKSIGLLAVKADFTWIPISKVIVFWNNLVLIGYFRQVKNILYVLDVMNLSQGVYVFMIFILKRDVLQTCYQKYLKVRGRLPKKPMTSMTDFLTNTRYVYRVYAYHKKSFQHLITYFMCTWWAGVAIIFKKFYFHDSVLRADQDRAKKCSWISCAMCMY